MNHNSDFASSSDSITVTPPYHKPPQPRPSTAEIELAAQNFDVLETLGSGGFGTVYKVRYRIDQGECAVKVIERRGLNWAGQIESIMNEINIMKELSHPSILPYIHHYISPNYAYIYVEYAPGGDLSKRLREYILPEEEAARCILELGEALEYIHNNQIIHRDIKLGNILLTSGDRLKFADFGLAAKAPGGFAHQNCGTSYAKAPEIFQHYSYTKAVDWWALGVVLYQMVIGEIPFTAGNQKTLEENIVTSILKIPSYVSPECSSLLKGLLSKRVYSRITCLKDLRSSDFLKKHLNTS